jgi:hypothetical protein
VWKAVALGDELWRENLARAASGRTMTGVSIEQVAAELLAWSAGVEWPACARTLTNTQLQAIYPDVGADVCRDLGQLLARSAYDEQHWREDLQETLARAFGVHSFSRGEVEAAIKRITVVLPLATSLSSRIRRAVLERITQLFRANLDLPATTVTSEAITVWKNRCAIPDQNDLSPDAKGVLFHIQLSANDPESLLLTTLPRALTAVGRPVQQWETFDLIDAYAGQLAGLIAEISSYEVVTPAVDRWLAGMLQAVRRMPTDKLPQERRRLVDLAAGEVGVWLRGQRLPAFAANLSIAEIQAIVPGTDPRVIAAAQQLLQHYGSTALQSLVSTTLPDAMGLGADTDGWNGNDVDQAVAYFTAACRLVEALPQKLRYQLLGAIGQMFAPGAAPGDLANTIRAWRANYVILPKDPLSANARVIYDSLGSLDDDIEGLLLYRLPTRITEVRAAYGNWSRWNTRDQYLDALGVAAKEITNLGKVDRTNGSADTLWSEFRERLARLSTDEQRWVVKAFRDEFAP